MLKVCLHCIADKDRERLADFASVKCLAFSSDGRMLALGGEDGAITVVDWLTLRVLSDMRRATVMLLGLVILPLLAFLDYQCSLRHRNRSFPCHLPVTMPVCSRQFVEGCTCSTLMQWCRHRGQNGLKDPVKDLDFSPAHKDKVLAATCEDGSCSLWAWERQLQIATLDLPPGESRLSFTATC